MKLEAKQRLVAAGPKQTLKLEIECSGDAYLTLVNLLGVIQHNCGVGHSATVAAFFDGDGADFVRIKGLPDGEYREMAEALGAYGGSFEEVHAHQANVHSVKYNEKDERILTTRKVYPMEGPDAS